jgi:tRNA(Ile)-lysidine synthase
MAMTTPKSPGHDLNARVLQALAPWRTAPAWRIAFSGGLDSTVLLHLLAELGRREHLPPLYAIHVHHGLQAVADAWPLHCQRICEGLDVPLQVIGVQVKAEASLEQAARDARYAAFTQCMATGDVLLTGQHRDDQAETLLLRLLRGAGVRGMAAMPVDRVLGKGRLLRPLLGIPRKELQAYACEHQLLWIEDPSNADSGLDRNYLRHQVLPALNARWPQAQATMARAAEHLNEAQQLLAEMAEDDLSRAQTLPAQSWLNLPSLSLEALTRLSEPRQRNALRHWLGPLTRLPDSNHWAGWRDLRDAGPGANPLWRMADGELHRAQGRIWWLSGSWLQTPEAGLRWPAASDTLVLPGNGTLRFQGPLPGGTLRVGYRQGGEVLRLPGRGHRDLKRLLNEHDVPVFVRGRLPLLFRDDVLAAVANLPALNACAHENWRLQWTPPTNDQSLS